jgi:hypothetical protein
MMLAVHKEFTVAISELSHIGVVCPRCDTEIITDVTKPVADSFPDACPCCKQPFGAYMTADIGKFRDAYRILTTRENAPKAFVRIRCTENAIPSNQ